MTTRVAIPRSSCEKDWIQSRFTQRARVRVRTHIVIENLLHTEELGKKFRDEGEGGANPEIGNAGPNPGEDCEKRLG